MKRSVVLLYFQNPALSFLKLLKRRCSGEKAKDKSEREHFFYLFSLFFHVSRQPLTSPFRPLGASCDLRPPRQQSPGRFPVSCHVGNNRNMRGAPGKQTVYCEAGWTGRSISPLSDFRTHTYRDTQTHTQTHTPIQTPTNTTHHTHLHTHTHKSSHLVR